MDRRGSYRDETAVTNGRRSSSRDVLQDTERRRSIKDDQTVDKGRRSSFRDANERRASYNRDASQEERRGSFRDVPGDTERRGSFRDVPQDAERRGSFRDVPQDTERRGSFRNDAVTSEKRRLSSSRDISQEGERRGSFRDDVAADKRRRSSSRDVPQDTDRRGSFRDVPQDAERRLSFRDAPQDAERRGSYRDVPQDTERRSSFRDDITVDTRRLSSSRDDVPETERRGSFRDVKDRRASYNRDVSQDEERRNSFMDATPNSERRRSIRDEILEAEQAERELEEQLDDRHSRPVSRNSIPRSPIPIIDIQEPQPDDPKSSSESENESELDAEFNLEEHAQSLQYRKSLSDILPDAQAVPQLVTYQQVGDEEDERPHSRSSAGSDVEGEQREPARDWIKPPTDRGPRLSIGQGMFNLLVRRFSSAGTEDATPVDQSAKSQEDEEVSRSPRGSITSLGVRKSSRGSDVDQEVLTSSRGSIGEQVNRSPRGSVGEQVDRSPRGSIGEQVNRSPRGSVGEQFDRSPRGSIGEQFSKSPRGSFTDQEISRSPRGSIGAQVSKSPRGSFVDQEISRSPRGSIGEQLSKSPRGSFIEQEVSRSPRGSVGDSFEDQETYWSPRGSIGEKDNLSPEDSMRESVSRSPRGSIGEQVSKSPRGSFVETEASRSPRGSIGGKVDKSPRGSIGNQEVSMSPRGSIGGQISKSPRGSFADQEASRSPRGSFVEEEPPRRSPRGSFTGQEAHRSPRGSTAGEVASRKSSTFEADYEDTDLPEEDRYQDTISKEDPGLSLTASLTSFIRRLSGGKVVTDVISNTDNSLQEIDTSRTNGKLHHDEHEAPNETTLPLETMTANIDTLEVQPPRDTEPPKKTVQNITTVTFCGCGFLGVYLVGAATYLQDHVPVLLRGRLAGSSVGSLIATCIACDVPLQILRENLLSTARMSRKYILGAFNPFFSLEDSLLKCTLRALPEDAHIRASGRVFLSLTRVSSLTNEIVSEFNSRDELIQALICCCFLPGLSGYTVPTFRGRRYIDGGLTNNNPLKNEETLAINAFSGDFDIMPEEDEDFLGQILPRIFDVSATRTNMRKVFRALLPPSPEELDKYYYYGYADAQKFMPVAGGSRRKSFLNNFFG
ncbi:uncharacterized protein LOC122252655 isoform X2 [Penaeus japonicus]|uniref:uncharacterized protein LOC122252655 isoform X2 n=1 Tax=Penaeus japonicus TaxID=27405 RepID=UPI001C71181C|nr:uncharacterized protein LOC122252655 isoform X2 [Penaeus japonicus]